MSRPKAWRLGLAMTLAAGFVAPPLSAQEAGEGGPSGLLRPSVGPEVEAVAQMRSAPEAATSTSEPSTPARLEGDLDAIPPVGEPATPPTGVEAPISAPQTPPPVMSKQPLRLGVLAGRDAARTLRTLGPFTEGLSGAIGRPAELLPMSSYRAMIESQKLGRIDGGFYSASAYALAQSACHCLEPLVAPAASDGTSAYFAILVTNSDASPEDLAGLKGKSMAVAAADSVGGRRMPLAALLAEGIDVESFFSDIRDVGSAQQAVRLMISGEVDAAFAWTSLSGDIAAGYSRGTLSDLVAAGEIEMSEVVLVWRSPAITHGPVALGTSATDAEKQALESYLLGLEQGDPAAYDALNPFYAGGYIPVNAEDYSGITVLADQDVDAIRIAGPDAAPVPADPRRR